jgi:hypothetical protein
MWINCINVQWKKIPVGARFSPPVQTGPGAHLAPCTMSTGSFPGVESGRGVTLTPHPLLVPKSKKRSRAIFLLSLRAFVVCKKGEIYLHMWRFFTRNLFFTHTCTLQNWINFSFQKYEKKILLVTTDKREVHENGKRWFLPPINK